MAESSHHFVVDYTAMPENSQMKNSNYSDANFLSPQKNNQARNRFRKHSLCVNPS